MSNILKKYWYSILIFLVILLGFYLRFKGYWANPSFGHDECGAAWNIKFKNYKELFGILRFLQVAPPLFLILTKFLTQVFGYSEKVFRFIPFITSFISIFAFYFLAKKSFNNKLAILFSIFLFVINQRLIVYSFEFKPYSSDVFCAITLLLLFLNININKINNKKIILYSLILALFPWFSFISAFIIAGGFLNIFLNDFKNNIRKKILLFMPLFLSGLIYLKICLFSNYTGTHMVSDWEKFFVTLNPLHFLWLLTESIKYLFFPVKFLLFVLILFIWGTIIYSNEKSETFKIAILGFATFLIASLFHIYPFSDRIILFLTPIYILFIAKPLETVSINKKIKSIILILIMLITFKPQIIWANQYLNSKLNVTKGEYAREMIAILTKNIKTNDVIFVSNLSNTEYAYYSSFFKITNKVIMEPQKSNRMEVLNSLPKHQYCWFYLTFANPESILKWIDKNAKIIKMVHAKNLNDYLIYTYIQ